MGDKKRHKSKKKLKEKCCEKHERKGKYCSSCPLKAECPVPD
jgi:hypothetical protein